MAVRAEVSASELNCSCMYLFYMPHLFKSREIYVPFKKKYTLSPIYLPYLATEANIYPQAKGQRCSFSYYSQSSKQAYKLCVVSPVKILHLNDEINDQFFPWRNKNRSIEGLLSFFSGCLVFLSFLVSECFTGFKAWALWMCGVIMLLPKKCG